METSQQASAPTYYKPSPSPGMFGTKIPSSVAFAVGVLLFLMPLSELKCAGQRLASKSGLDYAMGKDWKPITSGMFGKEDFQKQSADFGKEQKGNTQYLSIAAMALGAIGLLLCFGGSKGTNAGGVVTGVLAAGASIGLMLDQKKNFAASLSNQALKKVDDGAGSFGFDKIGKTMDDAKPVLGFTIWFYIAVAAFLVAAFFCYKRMQSNKT